jgi:hypothetical protein
MGLSLRPVPVLERVQLVPLRLACDSAFAEMDRKRQSKFDIAILAASVCRIIVAVRERTCVVPSVATCLSWG